MPKATQGVPYLVLPGDTLWAISAQAYGDPWKYELIFKANPIISDPDLIFPGQIIVIPVELPVFEPELEAEEDSELLSGADPQGLQLIINGTQIQVLNARVVRTMDTGTDRWTATVYWDPTDSDLYDLLRPYTYYESKVYVGGQLLVTGPIDTWEPSYTGQGQSMVIEGGSKTTVLVDSAVEPPYQLRNVTLNQVANELCSYHQITVEDNTPGLGVFKRATASPTDRIFEYLAKLAKQKNALISSTPKGHLLITQSAEDREDFGSIGDELARGIDYRVRFDGRNRYRNYRLRGKRRGKKAAVAVAIDKNMTVNRTWTGESGDLIGDELTAAAEWERSKRLTDALTLSIPVSDWYAPNDILWRENKYVTLISPTMFIPDGFQFLIRQVEYQYGTNGRKAVLSLVPPQVYTGEDLVEPWLL